MSCCGSRRVSLQGGLSARPSAHAQRVPVPPAAQAPSPPAVEGRQLVFERVAGPDGKAAAGPENGSEDSAPLLVQGRASGQHYSFNHVGDSLAVHPADWRQMFTVAGLRWKGDSG